MPHSARTACSRWCVLIGLILTLVAPLGAQAAWADLYAAANGDRRWVVQVSPQEEEPAAWIYFQADPESDWMPLARLGSDVRGIAAIGPELGIVLASGEWRIYWSGEWRYGTTPPDRGRVLALASHNNRIVAIIRRGDPPATSTAPALAAVQDPAPVQNPPAHSVDGPEEGAKGKAEEEETGAAPRSAPPAPSTTAPSLPRTALFTLLEGRWVPIAALPEEMELDLSAELSLALVADQPVFAIRRTGSIDLWRFAGERWQSLGGMPSGDIHRFRLLNGSIPRLWTAGASGIGQLHVFEEESPRTIALQATDEAAAATVRAMDTFGDTPHLLYLDGRDILLQPYDEAGATAGEPIRLSPPHAPADPRVGQWIEGILVAAMAFVLITALRQRQMEPPSTKGLVGLQLARLPQRGMAGAIDLWPIWIALLMVARWHYARSTPLETLLMEGRTQGLLLGAAALYVLHTLTLELLTGRSLGKMIFGLRVTDFNGAPPARSALLVRNLLRILDVYILFPLPLLLVLYTPLRQRMGDLAARTIVVEKATAPQPPEEEQEQ